MRGLKILLFVSFVSGLGYALLLIIVPQQSAKIGAGPDELLWARFLVGEEMHKILKGSRLEILDQAGHCAHDDQSTIFNQLTLDFLESAVDVS